MSSDVWRDWFRSSLWGWKWNYVPVQDDVDDWFEVEA
jgi:hypothetical protein